MNWMTLINVLVFLCTALRGDISDSDILLHYGMSCTPYIFESHECWRPSTATLLHSGIRHLENSMLVLFVIGDSLEHTLGHVRYLVFYLSSAVNASAASLVVEVAMGQKVLNAGVSGVVFAVLGGLIWVLIRNSGRFEESRIHNLLFFSGMALLSSFFIGGVDSVARAGGLLVGSLLTVVLYRRPAVTLFSVDMT